MHTLDPHLRHETARILRNLGATGPEIGWTGKLDTDREAGWWAQAEWRGTPVRVENQPSPNTACLWLAVQLLDRDARAREAAAELEADPKPGAATQGKPCHCHYGIGADVCPEHEPRRKP